jgi:hypothetical protein
MSVSSMKPGDVNHHQSGGNRQFKKCQSDRSPNPPCYLTLNQARIVENRVSENHTLSTHKK